jgi:hypothetical protein
MINTPPGARQPAGPGVARPGYEGSGPVHPWLPCMPIGNADDRCLFDLASAW